MGRLDTLIDIVYERYKDRFFDQETCLVDVGGYRLVFHPKLCLR